MNTPATDPPEENGLVDVSEMSLLQILSDPDPQLRDTVAGMVKLVGNSKVTQGWGNYLENR